MKSFEEFWPHYVAEHSQPATRTLHAIGTGVGLACAVALAARGKWKWLPVAFVPGYGAAWLSHFLIERNKPATFEHPVWSLMGDYKMIGLMLTGRMDEEISRLGLEANSENGHESSEA
ncbi:MAG TPA: DUF962 domain-containing protein [Pyrinomonadaceae bacterium]|nr:DUF962 domain-containing protein [Pyrinomonadaceae bacterium]